MTETIAWWPLIGWIWMGIFIGFVMGVALITLLASGRQGELEQENLHLRWVRDSLKEEILRLEKPSKPKPRKRRKRNVRPN
jgi:hypothetical protein|tara:strand:- start:355 stop:597 length:243 start_codon:yes stop_codon:yes gene_type:complete